MFNSINEKMLLEIFKIGAPSLKEHKIADYIKTYLSSNKIEFNTDSTGNIFNMSHENRPLLSAHMDTVQREEDSFLANFIRIREYKNKKILKGLGIIGGDDKCGIYIMLELITMYKNLNFVFSVEEEIGGKGISEFVKNRDFSKVLYGIVLDRRYGTDIICENNNYGTLEFQKDLEAIGTKFSYKPTTGSFSDANSISNHISCANLSVGYHNPHSKHEYVDLDDLLKAVIYTEEIINTLTKKYAAPVSKYKYTGYLNNYSGGNSQYDDAYWKDWSTKYPKKTSVVENKTIKFNSDGLSTTGTCETCNRYTTIYKIKKINKLMCSNCLTDTFEEIVEVDRIKDPFNSGESLVM